MGWNRLPALALCLGVVTGCGPGRESSESTDPVPAGCEPGGPVVALNRTGDSDGLAEVVVSDKGGDAVVVTGDWVATSPSFSPDGRTLVVVRADGDYESAGPDSTSLWTLSIDGTEPRMLTEGQMDDHPAWSPDGSTIAFSRYSPSAAGDSMQITTVPAGGGDVRPLVPNDGSDDVAPAWSPDGRTLAFIRAERQPDRSSTTTVWIADADGSNARQVAAVPDAHSLDWHPDGNQLLVSSFAAEDGGVALVAVDSGEVRQIAEHATFAAWTPDGNGIYHFTKDGAPQPSWWRLARGRVAGDRLERDTYVGGIEGYLYRNFGLAVSPCP